MRGLLAGGALAVAALIGGEAAAAPSVQFKDAVARVTVIPEDRADVRVEFLTRNPAVPLTVTTIGDRTVLDGDLDRKIQNCASANGETSVGVRGVGKVAWKNMPQVVVRTPRDARISVSGAVFGSIGRSNSVSFDNAGCGDWTVANVNGALALSTAGSGDVKAGSARSVKVNVAGSGDTNLGRVGDSLDANIAGSGDIHAVSVGGDLRANIAGSGDVRVEGGQARVLKASIVGSGDVVFGGVAQALEAHVMGSGDVVAARVAGPVRKSVMGSGEVRVGD